MKTIVKHQNKLAYAKFDHFHLRELKLFFKLLSLLEENKNIYTYTAKDIKNFIGMKDQSYEKFEILIRSLQKKTIEIFTNSQDSDVYSIFSILKFKRGEKIIEVKYGEDFLPLILDVDKNYCRYNLKYIENMKSKYSILFYIRSKAEYFKGKFTLTKEDFFKFLGKNYSSNNIDKKIIFPMIEEINSLTDLNLKVSKTYEGQKRGRTKVSGYTFQISKKKITLSEAIKKSVKLAKKNIFISKSKVLNDETVERLLEEFSEKKLVDGLLYAYKEINKDFSTLKYLKTVISRAMEPIEVKKEEKENINKDINTPEEKQQTNYPQYSEKEILIYTLKHENLSLDFFETMKRKNKVMYYNTLKVQLKKMQKSQSE